MSRKTRKTILAVSSGGGHWAQLRRIALAFDGHDVAYVTVDPRFRQDVPDARFYAVRDASRWSKLGLLSMAAQLLRVVLRERPDVVVSTGAAPGYVAVRFAKWLGAKTVWVDSIANASELSMSGKLARAHADLFLTQWPHLADPAGKGPRFAGSIL